MMLNTCFLERAERFPFVLVGSGNQSNYFPPSPPVPFQHCSITAIRPYYPHIIIDISARSFCWKSTWLPLSVSGAISLMYTAIGEQHVVSTHVRCERGESRLALSPIMHRPSRRVERWFTVTSLMLLARDNDSSSHICHDITRYE